MTLNSVIEQLVAVLSSPVGQSIALAAGLAVLAVAFKAARFVIALARKESKRTETKLDDELVEIAEDAVDAAEAPAKTVFRRLLGSLRKK